MKVGDESSELELRRYLRVLSRRKMVVALSVLVVVVTAIGVSYLQTPVYSATADLLITPTINSSSVFSQSGGQPIDPTREIDTQIQIMTSRPVQDKVRTQLGAAPAVAVAPVGLTNVVGISASSTIPQQAADVANAYANAYVDFQRTQAVNNLLLAGNQIQVKIDDLQRQIDALNAQVAAAAPKDQPTLLANLGPQRDNLVTQQGLFKQRLDQLQVDASVKSGEAQVVTPASASTTPSSPRPLHNAILALAAGLLLGLAAAFVLDFFDDSVRTREDVDRAVHGLPDLGRIPRIVGWKTNERPMVISIEQPMSPAAEAYRSLRTSIQFVGMDHAAHIIQVTSANAEEGKTTTLSNLAVALASAGERVCMCCCDLRRPRIHEFFGLDNAIGFTSVILGQRAMSAAIQKVPGIERLSLLASGPIPPNPSELLASDRAAEVIRSLGDMFDVVLVDCPPVLPVTDAAVLAAVADATIVVVSIGSSARREVARAMELLRQVDAPLIGTVLNGVSSDGGDGYSRYYRYYKDDRTTNDPMVERGEKLVGQGSSRI